jgi:hypothetical protein
MGARGERSFTESGEALSKLLHVCRRGLVQMTDRMSEGEARGYCATVM